MIIGIDASRAFVRQRTGIEEYSYQVIKHLRSELADQSVVLYLRAGQKVNFDLPPNWKIKTIRLGLFWTQIGLSFEILRSPADVLFVPSHVVPFIHPRQTVVTVHGLEFERCPTAYSVWQRAYMRFFIRCSCHWSSRIIAVSESTSNDLKEIYGVPEEKIQVVYEGCPDADPAAPVGPVRPVSGPYYLFIGRLEARKNIVNIIKAFEIIKREYGSSHRLVLAGSPGHGFWDIEAAINRSEYSADVIQLGYVKDEEKKELLRGALVLTFPSLYEGFGLPVLEAQAMGVPVITSKNSSLAEVAGDADVLVDPLNPSEIAAKIWSLTADSALRDGIIAKGRQNIERFSWKGCARETARIIMSKI